MTRLTTLGFVGALSACLVASSSGCSGTPPGEFIIYQNQVPNSWTAARSRRRWARTIAANGQLDVRLLPDGPDGYQLFPLLQNNFPAPSAGGVDANRIALSGFDIDVDVLDPTGTDPVTSLINGYRMADPSDANHALVHYSQVTSGSVASGAAATRPRASTSSRDKLAQNIRALRRTCRKTSGPRSWSRCARAARRS